MKTVTAKLMLVLFVFLCLLPFALAEEARVHSNEEVVARQEAIRKNFGQLYEKLERLANELSEKDPDRASLCTESVRYIREKMVPDAFERMMTHARNRQLNLAMRELEVIIGALNEILGILEGTGDIERRIERLKQFIGRLEKLIVRQEELRSRTIKEAEALKGIAPEQSKLSSDTSTAGQEIEDGGFPDVGSKVKQASDAMQDAADNLKENKKQKATDYQDSAIVLLRTALEQAKKTAQMLEAVKRSIRLKELQKLLKELLIKQQKVLASTEGVAAAASKLKALTRPLKLKLAAQAREQKAVNDCYKLLAERMTADDDNGVFSYLTAMIVTDSNTVLDGLSELKYGPLVQLPQRAIIRRLEAMIRGIDELMKPGAEEASGGGAGGGGSGAIVLPLAQLVALRSEQADIVEMTEYCISQPDSEGRSKALGQLVVRQAECGRLLRKILEDASR